MISRVPRWSPAGGGLAVALVALVAVAKDAGIQRTLLQRADLEGNEPKECILGSAEIPAGASAGKHFHHGIEVGYVVEGEAEVLVDGEPPRRLRSGDSYSIPARRPHEPRSVGAGPVKVIATYVVEKGKPLAEPVK